MFFQNDGQPLEKLRATFFETMGNVFQNDGQCFLGYTKFEVENSAFLNEKKNLISNFEVENCYNPILRNLALWLKTANVIVSWNLLNTCIDTE